MESGHNHAVLGRGTLARSQQVTEYFAAHGGSAAQAQQQAFAWIARQVQTQASLLAYIDVFWTLMVISIAAVPLALVLRRTRGGEAGSPTVH
jgi:DHA2 family multidrug resistance protein